MHHEPLHDGRGQAGHLGQQPVAEGADRGIQAVAHHRETDASGPGGEVEQVDRVERLKALQGLPDAQIGLGRGQVVADHELTVVAQTTDELLELEAEQPAVGAELDDVVLDLGRDATHHLEALQHGSHVAHRDQVFDLEGGKGRGDLVEAHLVALEGGQGLVGTGQHLF